MVVATMRPDHSNAVGNASAGSFEFLLLRQLFLVLVLGQGCACTFFPV